MPARIAPQLSAQFLSRHAARLTPTRVLVHRGPTARHFSSQGPEYDWIDGAENVSGYTQGGYHPIHLGDVLHSRYEVVDKLGYGGWSTVWLVRDLHDESLVAAKVAAADSIPHEMDIIRHLQGSSSAASSIPRILDQFTIQGPNGSHPCYTTALALCTLQEDPYDGVFPLGAARAIAYRLTEAVAHVHSRGYVHGGAP